MKFSKKILAIGIFSATITSSASAGFLTMDWVNALQAHAKTIMEEIQHNEKLIAAAELYQTKIAETFKKAIEDQKRTAQELRDSSQLKVDEYQTDLVKNSLPSIGGCGRLVIQSSMAENECAEGVVTNYKLDESKSKSTADGALLTSKYNEYDPIEYLNKIAVAYGKTGETLTMKDLESYIENPNTMPIEDYVTIREQIDIAKLINDEKYDFVNNDGVIPKISKPANKESSGNSNSNTDSNLVNNSVPNKIIPFKNDSNAVLNLGISNIFKNGKTLNPDEINTSMTSVKLLVPDYTPNLMRRVDSIDNNSRIQDYKMMAYTEAAKAPLFELINERVSLDSENKASDEENLKLMSDQLIGINGVDGIPLVDKIKSDNNSSISQSNKLIAEMVRAKLLSDYIKLKDSIMMQYQLTMRLAMRLESNK